MKTTNYEISKELAEAGFQAETQFYWVKWNTGEPELVHEKEQTPALIEKVGAWDLETILEALPKEIKKLHFWATWSTSSDCYIFGYIDGIVRNTELETATEENESLADTAARLWLKLKKEGLV